MYYFYLLSYVSELVKEMNRMAVVKYNINGEFVIPRQLGNTYTTIRWIEKMIKEKREDSKSKDNKGGEDD